MKVVAIIPARMASTRFPGKPLCSICGMTMIEHVYRRVSLCKSLSEVYVATCDKKIAEAVKRFGGRAIMTSSKHKTCCDRVAEACRNIETDAEVIVNVQGDEPLIYPEMIKDAVAPFYNDNQLVCTNVISRIDNQKDFEGPNFIKVVKDSNDYALYFSREPIPSNKKYAKEYPRYRQVCILPFRREFLLKFVVMPSTPLETIESIDMLRIIENGYKIKLVETKFNTMAVDNESDRKRVEGIMKNDPLYKTYKK